MWQERQKVLDALLERPIVSTADVRHNRTTFAAANNLVSRLETRHPAWITGFTRNRTATTLRQAVRRRAIVTSLRRSNRRTPGALNSTMATSLTSAA